MHREINGLETVGQAVSPAGLWPEKKPPYSALRDFGIDFSDGCHNIVRFPAGELRIHRNTRETTEDVDRARAAGGAVLDRPASLGIKRRPRWMQGALVFDVRLSRQEHGPTRRRSGHVFRFHGRYVPVAQLLAFESQKNP